MADSFDLTLDDVLDQLEAVPALGLLAAAFRAGLGPIGIDATEMKISFPIDLIEDLVSALTPPGGTDPPTVLPGLTLGDPMQPLQRIAEAINAAEALLNQQSLVVAQGSVEVTLGIDVGGAQADAKLRLDIRPREFN